VGCGGYARTVLGLQLIDLLRRGGTACVPCHRRAVRPRLRLRLLLGLCATARPSAPCPRRLGLGLGHGVDRLLQPVPARSAHLDAPPPQTVHELPHPCIVGTAADTTATATATTTTTTTTATTTHAHTHTSAAATTATGVSMGASPDECQDSIQSAAGGEKG
jgi:hypothetical protein